MQRGDSVARLYLLYQAGMLALALAVIWLLTVPDEYGWVQPAQLAIWAIFLTDYLVRLVRSHDRRYFVRHNVIDLIAVLPFDLLLLPFGNEELFGIGRVVYLIRIVRLIRAGAVLWDVSANIRGVLGTNGLSQVLLFAVVAVLLGGAAINQVEPEIASLGDGLWWSLVTATTVGYGDIAPKTAPGRLVAAGLMIVGITTFGMLTGSIATYFLQRRQPLDPHVEQLIGLLQRWEDLSPIERRRAASVLGALAREEPAEEARPPERVRDPA